MSPPRTLLCVLSAALVALMACSGAGPKTHVLNANLTRARLNERMSANFHKGMTFEEVNAKLTELNVGEGVRRTYSQDPPREMLVRLLPPGGVWISESDQSVEWWDVTFSFDAQDRLAAARAFNGGARYIDGFANYISPEPPPGTRVRFPQAIPPPLAPPPGDPIPLP